MRSAGRTFLSLCGVAVVVGGLAAALALVLIPLRLVAVTGGIGYCGPGLSSDNAVQVRADPGIVNTGGGAASRRRRPRNASSSTCAPARPTAG